MTRRLLFLLNDAQFFVSHRLPLAVEAKKSGFEVHVAVPYQKEASQEIISKGIIQHDVPLKRGSRGIIGELKLIFSYWKLIGFIRPEIIHAVTMKPVLYGGLVARIRRIPALINAITGLGYLFLKNNIITSVQRKIVMFLYRIALNHPNHRAIFQNLDDLELFVSNRLVNSKNQVIIRGCGVNLDEFIDSPEPSGPTVILFPARIIGDKGIREFVAAARILKAENNNLIFRIAGRLDPDNPTEIDEDTVSFWQSQGWVEWSGYLADMPKAFSSCHIVCMPSYREGLPRSLIEAAACGRPIVTTDVPGCREIVEHEVNGYLVPVRNADALAEALTKLISDPSLRKIMGSRSRKIAANNFSIEKFISESFEVYRSVIKEYK